MPISKADAEISTKRVNSELHSLTPSALITMFEIDISDVLFALGLAAEGDKTEVVFRLHNTQKLNGTTIYWRGQPYVPVPIQADGFEWSGKGTLPRPRLMLTSSDEGLDYFTVLKDRIRKLGDLAGAKVTRIRTFAKYLDKETFDGGGETPKGFAEDSLAELPRDIYYIDRKSADNKFGLEFELVSLLDLQDVKLPKRVVMGDKCSWEYRGEGCMYEYADSRNEDIHGEEGVYTSLPPVAFPIANENDELISEIIDFQTYRFQRKGVYEIGKTYQKGNFVYIERGGIKYYFVSKINDNTNAPPNTTYWVEDVCSKSVKGCKCRWKQNAFIQANGYNPNGYLPYGGFPSVNKLDA